VEVNGQQIDTRGIVIATGAKPLVPPIPGLGEVDYYTSDSVWSMEQLPRQLLVLGGGPIGCELAQSFARLGSRVILVDMLDRLLPREDEDVSELIQAALIRDGVQMLLGRKAIRAEKMGDLSQLVVEQHGQEEPVPFTALLIAVGRRADTQSLGLEHLGIETNRDGTIVTNQYLQTSIPSIYACGDVAGPYQFTHMASHQAWYATVNALFGWLWKFRVNYSVVPWATYTDPEVATVGLTESAARAQAVPHEVTYFNMADVNRSVTDGELTGFIKVLTPPGSDKVLGATIVGYHGSELIGDYVTAMSHGLGLNKLMATIHIYPTLGEVNKFAASTWKKAHAPERLISLLGRFQGWLRR
jgi:pyruvate/2-oxoglutarate dehydrogenase complex dihydrolipoamide dehydrogenase (E3) component